MSRPFPIPISFVITELDVGGAERALVRIVTGLSRERWIPHVICLSGEGPLVRPLNDAGVPVTCLQADRVMSPSGIWRATVGLTRTLRQQRPQIVQTFLFHANIAGRLAARRAGVPHVLSGIRVADRRGRWRLWLDRCTERLVDRHVCVSRGVADFCVRTSRLDPARIEVIPNGVDVEEFREAPPADLSAFGIGSDAEVILAVGRLDSQKDPLSLVQAVIPVARQRPQLHLLFVGDGPLRKQLAQESEAAGLADRIHLAGWRPDVPNLMKAADLFVLPSRWEGMPNVILEAAAAGIPIVATATEGTSELIVSGETGVLVPCGAVDALGAAIRQTLEQPGLPHRMAGSLQHMVAERFTWDSVVAAYECLYDSLVTGRV